MRVLLDERPCPVTAESIQDALAQAAATAESNGRVIVEIHVDGSPWGEQELASIEHCTSTADELVLVTADRRELICTTLGDAADALKDIDALQQQAAELLQIGDQPEGMERLGEAFDLWLMVQRAIGMCTDAADLDLEAIRHQEESVARSVTTLQDQLRGIRDALSERDSVAVADALLYEMPDVIAHWRGILSTLQKAVREPDDDGRHDARPEPTDPPRGT